MTLSDTSEWHHMTLGDIRYHCVPPESMWHVDHPISKAPITSRPLRPSPDSTFIQRAATFHSSLTLTLKLEINNINTNNRNHTQKHLCKNLSYFSKVTVVWSHYQFIGLLCWLWMQPQFNATVQLTKALKLFSEKSAYGSRREFRYLDSSMLMRLEWCHSG